MVNKAVNYKEGSGGGEQDQVAADDFLSKDAENKKKRKGRNKDSQDQSGKHVKRLWKRRALGDI